MSSVTVGWGDGAVDSYDVADPDDWTLTGKTHTYAAAGTFTVKVFGPNGGSDEQAVTVTAPVVIPLDG